ncbi:PAAR domain-containing protein [Thalassospira xiamenensis]|uniref:Zn-binding Pro-Ala-Ala-Arg (PAAR) domain-containing protein, incolved in TypeVI secretion n=1 Tax=Thalassospira xiamenensis TaxID=220697 RepID=A0A367XHK4_9PROT|nr:PAAR domain-containing protein [Thalassospira xiamenensis]KZB51066.1 hypothetical protein AUP41_08145 [Thalassospira xiamenensis]RCK53155.1 hypothetical protein TH44_02830 [Thalassospira xiamenensis]
MKPVARLGDKHDCPHHGSNSIVAGGTALIDSQPVARVGDKCGCGATIVEGSSQSMNDGKPIAYLGCKTSCGGVITSASATAKVKP